MNTRAYKPPPPASSTSKHKQQVNAPHSQATDTCVNTAYNQQKETPVKIHHDPDFDYDYGSDSDSDRWLYRHEQDDY